MDVFIRFNYVRLVAHFDSVADLNNWVLNCELPEPYMCTIHIGGDVFVLDKYILTLTHR